jgi:hypothetical protein
VAIIWYASPSPLFFTSCHFSHNTTSTAHPAATRRSLGARTGVCAGSSRTTSCGPLASTSLYCALSSAVITFLDQGIMLPPASWCTRDGDEEGVSRA